MSIQVPYEQTGRRRQKARTRAALVGAARELLAEGRTATVEDSAARAGVSRATAYRYFANQRALLTAVQPRLDAETMLGESPPAGVEERLALAIGEIISMTLDTEPALRAMLRLSLEPGPHTEEELPFRRGRRIDWVADALEPLRARLPAADFDRLVVAIAASVGIDSLVWLTDVAGLSRDEAVEVMRWSALALLRAATGAG
ncbi:MAG TPA: helix-turn-helix domain-containing protein [Thermoleophilaceae bacterium]|jgi:AcrR family transcriptional regulator